MVQSLNPYILVLCMDMQLFLICLWIKIRVTSFFTTYFLIQKWCDSSHPTFFYGGASPTLPFFIVNKNPRPPVLISV